MFAGQFTTSFAFDAFADGGVRHHGRRRFIEAPPARVAGSLTRAEITLP
jgi:hypothetical protein